MWFNLAWKNIRNSPLATALTLVLFALGIGLTNLLMLLNHQLERQFVKNLAGIDLVIGAKGSPLQMILCNMYHIDAPTGNIPLKVAQPFLNPNHPFIKKAIPLSLGDSYKGYRIVGSTNDFPNWYDAKLASGRLPNQSLEVVIGTSVAEKTGLKLGSTFKSNHGLVREDDGIDHAHEADDFKVVGIFAPSGSVADQLVLTPLESIWAVHEHEKEAIPDSLRAITSVLVQFKGRNIATLNMQRSINENTELQAATPAIEIQRLRELTGAGEALLRGLAYLIIMVSGLSIFIALYQSLRERKYELALLRVMGAARLGVFWLICVEGILLALLGSLIGILLSHIAMHVLGGYMTGQYRYTFTGGLFLKQEWFFMVGALFIGFIAALLPASSAYRTDISKTLADA
jgi:putative ABC transport system permease protein